MIDDFCIFEWRVQCQAKLAFLSSREIMVLMEGLGLQEFVGHK